MDSYEKLLDSAYEDIKIVEGSGGRFEIPSIEGFFQGRKTIITNLNQIASRLRRNTETLQRFLSKELATPIVKQGERFVLGSKISSKKINPKIAEYVNEFVLCKTCKKPDTEIVKQDRQSMLHCLACGAKHPIRGKI
ncbi:MAG: translation initiation factor IF-2 subunit beta [Nanoarchaeota archaeon]|nr:translation initiation factor IF-2 subunit beta [Nanoarchaeota archaeon]